MKKNYGKYEGCVVIINQTKPGNYIFNLRALVFNDRIYTLRFHYDEHSIKGVSEDHCLFLSEKDYKNTEYSEFNLKKVKPSKLEKDVLKTLKKGKKEVIIPIKTGKGTVPINIK